MTDTRLIELGQRLAEAALVGIKPGKKPKTKEELRKEKVKPRQQESVKKKKLNPMQKALVKKSSEKLVEKLRGLAVLNTEQTDIATRNKKSLTWGYPNKVTPKEIYTVFGAERNGARVVFENKPLGVSFEVSPIEKIIYLNYFYYPKRAPDVKQNYPPYMTMYFLQAYADSFRYTIIIPDDVSSGNYFGASYYASNYGFYPRKIRIPGDNMIRKPCPKALQKWIKERCTDSLETCLQNAQDDLVLQQLTASSCWTETKDTLYNFGNSKTRNRKNEGFKQIKYRGNPKSLYRGEMTNFRVEGTGMVFTLDRQWEYKGEFKNGQLHGYGVETGPMGFRREGYWKDGLAVSKHDFESQSLFPTPPPEEDLRHMIGDSKLQRFLEKVAKVPEGSKEVNLTGVLPATDHLPQTRVNWFNKETDIDEEEILKTFPFLQDGRDTNLGYLLKYFMWGIEDRNLSVSNFIIVHRKVLDILMNIPSVKESGISLTEENLDKIQKAISKYEIENKRRGLEVSNSIDRMKAELVRLVGMGKIRYPEGDYVGQTSNGQPHGVGSMKFDNGDFYKGQWHMGKFHGAGELETKATDDFQKGYFTDGVWTTGEKDTWIFNTLTDMADELAQDNPERVLVNEKDDSRQKYQPPLQPDTSAFFNYFKFYIDPLGRYELTYLTEEGKVVPDESFHIHLSSIDSMSFDENVIDGTVMDEVARAIQEKTIDMNDLELEVTPIPRSEEWESREYMEFLKSMESPESESDDDVMSVDDDAFRPPLPNRAPPPLPSRQRAPSPVY